MKLGLLSGGYPPDFDAIGQYTKRLAETLATMGHEVSVFTGATPGLMPAPGPHPSSLPVSRFFDPTQPGTIKGLPGACRERGKLDWLILQFNPFSFGPRGWCTALPGVLWRLRREQGTRIAVYFHETHVPAWPAKFLIMLAWQYPVFARLAAGADFTFVSTNRWKKQVCRWRPAATCVHVPVGSNLPCCELTKAEARSMLDLPDSPLLGIFGNAHPSRLVDWISHGAKQIAREKTDAVLLYAGKDGSAISQACNSCGIPFLDHGLLPDDQVSLRLRCMDVLLSPFVDGISTRRSSVIAALQHDLAVLSTSTPESDELMLAHPLVHCSPMKDGVSAFGKLASEWGSGRRNRQDLPQFSSSRFAWSAIASEIVEQLEASK